MRRASACRAGDRGPRRLAAPAAAAPGQFFGIMKGQPLDHHDFRQAEVGRGRVGALRDQLVRGPAAPSARGTGAPPTSWSATSRREGSGRCRSSTAPRSGSPGAPSSRPLAARRTSRPGGLPDPRRRTATGPPALTGAGRMRPHTRRGAGPINAWQIWNEPNLSKFFPRKGMTRKYAKLVRISHAAITAADRGAKVVLAGCPDTRGPPPGASSTSSTGSTGSSRISTPPRCTPTRPTSASSRRSFAGSQGDEDAPRLRDRALAHRARVGVRRRTRRWPINKGAQGQKRMLQKAFRVVLNKTSLVAHRAAVLVRLARPAGGTGHYCSFCASAGLLRHNHKPKPAYRAYRHFAR